ncbi:MAG: FHA domain-containing protein [Proteobacteria bacterium]|nr:FHA domain-containing protein [Pseudomonadota bacterium]
MYKLVISDDEGRTTVVPLVRDEIAIGRTEGNTIRLTERNVSRQHAELRRYNGAYHLRDLQSYNGVYLNGQRVEGEPELQAGDKFSIGDYVLAIELDRDTDSPPAPVAAAIPTQPAQLPPRVVMIGGATPGAEFSLSDGVYRMGRATNMDIQLNDRTVAREHAQIHGQNGVFRLIDSGTPLTTYLNGAPVTEATLGPGDVIQVGRAVLRYVPAGLDFLFDPEEAAQYIIDVPVAQRRLAPAVFASVALACLAGAIWFATSQGTTPGSGGSAKVEPAPDNPPVTRGVTRIDKRESVAELRARCEAAVAAGDYALAVRHAKRALKREPRDRAARACRDRARLQLDDQQAYAAGKHALEQGDAKGAYLHFSQLSPDGAFAAKPELAEAARRYAGERLEQLRRMIEAKDTTGADAELRAVRKLSDLPQQVLQELETLETRLDALKQPAPAKVVRAPAPRRRRPRRRAARSPQPAAVKEVRAANQEPAPEADPADLDKVVNDCLVRGDQACVIQALGNGQARTAQQWAILIETYRAAGLMDDALRAMKSYSERYPGSRRTAGYLRILETYSEK